MGFRRLFKGIGIVFAFSASGCLSPLTSILQHNSQIQGGSNGNSNCVGVLGQPLGFCSTPTQSLSLGSSELVNVSLSAGLGVESDIVLSVDNSDLAPTDPNSYIGISIFPNFIHLVPGTTQSITVSINVDSRAPSVTSHFRILASPVSLPGMAPAVADIPLMVSAVYEIDLLGSGVRDHWSVPQSVALSPHGEGTTVRFVNLDPLLDHVVLSDQLSLIPLSPSLIPATSNGASLGGVYSVIIPPGPEVTLNYWCSVHEGPASAHQLVLNLGGGSAIPTPAPPAPAPAPPPPIPIPKTSPTPPPTPKISPVPVVPKCGGSVLC
jgi:hypothetical protein